MSKSRSKGDDFIAGYLKKYVGTYRVLADYDLDTNDFPRDEFGNIDKDFDDYYIKCKKGIKIRQGKGLIMSCYIPSKNVGLNILRQIYSDKICQYNKQKNKEIVKALESELLIEIDILDGEVFFTFKPKHLEYIANLVGASNCGASVSPLSKKNLPKATYEIPEDDMEKYRGVIGEFNFKDKDKLPRLNAINREFERKLRKICGKDFKSEQKQLMLNRKSYIHKKGLWSDYLEFLKLGFKEYEVVLLK